MIDRQLSDYITQARAQGMTDEQIRQELLSAGWQAEDVDVAFGGSSADPTVSTPVVLLKARQLLKIAKQKRKDKRKLTLQFGFLVSLVVAAFFGLAIFATSSPILSVGVGILLGIVIMLYMVALIEVIGNTNSSSFPEVIGTTFRKLSGLIWVLILTAFIINGGYGLLIVPGVLFSVWFGFGLFSYLLERRTGLEALSRSFHLVKGHFWSTVWRFLVIYLVIVGEALLFGLLLGVLTLLAIFLSAGTFSSDGLVASFLLGGALVYIYVAVLAAFLFYILFLIPLIVSYFVAYFENLKQIKTEPFAYKPGSMTKYLLLALAGWLIIVGWYVFVGRNSSTSTNETKSPYNFEGN